MKRKSLLVTISVLFLAIFTSCGQEDENNELQSSNDREVSDHTNLESDEIEESSPKDTTKREEKNGEKEAITKEITSLPFDEQLLAQGYELKNLPNGFPFEIPYHWILVEDNLNDSASKNGEVTFCYDLPLTTEQVASHVDYFDHVIHEHHGNAQEILHTTTFAMDFGYTTIDGKMNFFLDVFNHTCLTMTLIFAENEAYGEDPHTMMSSEELAKEQSRTGHLDDAKESASGEGRQRSVISGYEALLQELTENNSLKQNEYSSIREKIKSGEMEMIHLAQGYPKIFPYEWYLLQMTADHGDGSWAGTFCTDAPIKQTILKHHKMLAEINANIIDFKVMSDATSNEKSSVQFTFNDEYGTGSWHGSTQLYVGQEGALQNHRCIDVSMEFSDEILKE